MKNSIKISLILLFALFATYSQATIEALDPTQTDMEGVKALVFLSGGSCYDNIEDKDLSPQIEADCHPLAEGISFYTDQDIRVAVQVDLQVISTTFNAGTSDLTLATGDTYRSIKSGTVNYTNDVLDWEYYFTSAEHPEINGYDSGSQFSDEFIDVGQLADKEAYNMISGPNTFSVGTWLATIKVENETFKTTFNIIARPVPLPSTLALFGLGFLMMKRRILK